MQELWYCSLVVLFLDVADLVENDVIEVLKLRDLLVDCLVLPAVEDLLCRREERSGEQRDGNLAICVVTCRSNVRA